MLKPILAVVVVSIPLFAYPLQSSSARGGPSPCDSNPHNPILMVDVQGATLLGPVLSHLAVYADGSASYAAAGLQSARMSSAALHPNDLNQLMRRLAAAGAYGLCDDATVLLDVPTTTVTVFDGGTDAHAHSFSYQGGLGAYAPVNAAIEQFIDQVFPSP